MKTKCKHGTFKYGKCEECSKETAKSTFSDTDTDIPTEREVERNFHAWSWFGTQYSTAEVKEA